MANMSIYKTESFEDLFAMDVSGFAEEALKESAEVLEREMKASARSSVKHPGESDMINSIKASKVKKTKNGAYIVNVGPRGYSSHTYYAKDGKGKRTTRKYKVSNALKAIWKEYGIPGKQEKQPFIQKATNQAENKVLEIIEKKFNQRAKL